MDGGIPWNIVAPVATTFVGLVGWIGRKIWAIAEKHAERRTVAFEAIAPSIKETFEEMRSHVTSHADEHVKVVKEAETRIVGVVNEAEKRLITEIGMSKRLAVVEAAVISEREKAAVDPTSPERSESRPPATSHSSGVQRLRPSRPGVAT